MSLRYSTLDSARSQIRLLRVQATQASPPDDPAETAFFDETPVRCSIEIVSLDENPEFVALSYVWGDPNKTVPITIDGTEISVTQNLRRALAVHSSRQPQYRIWVDAVCINQLNLGEKTSQIRMMSRIYEKAVIVFCWLGLANAQIRDYLGWRTWLDKDSSKQSRSRQAFSYVWRWNLFLLKERKPLSRSEVQFRMSIASVVKGQTDFLGLPYFERMWTLQESILPRPERTVFAVGPYIVSNFDPRKVNVFYPPPKVTALLTGLSRQLRNPQNPVQNTSIDPFDSSTSLRGGAALHMAHLQTAWREPEVAFGDGDSPQSHDSMRSQLARLLVTTGDRKCHNPRDKIFALLSLIRTGDDDRENTDVARASAFEVHATRERWLAIDYTKQAELVIRDALYYAHVAESPIFLHYILKLYQPQQGALQRRQRSLSQRKEDARSPTPRGLEPVVMGVYSCGRSYMAPTWLPDMTQRNFFESPGMHLPMCNHSTLESIFWDALDYPHDASRRQDHLIFSAKHVGKVVCMISFPNATVDIVNVLTILAYLTTIHDTTITQPINPLNLHATAASHYGVDPSSIPIEVRHEFPLNKSYHDLVVQIANKKHLYLRFCRAVLTDIYNVTHVVDRAFEENIFFWISLQYSLRSLDEKPEWNTNLRAQNVRMAEEITQRVRGSTLALLDSGNFVICTDLVDIGDVVVLSYAFADMLLLRPDCLICRQEDGSCAGHNVQEDLWHQGLSLQTHLLVGYPFVDGLRFDKNYDETFAKEIGGKDHQYIVLG